MTNLKKTLAVVLAFAMILSMGAVSTFAAYSDVTAGTVVSEAVGILSNLGILTGFEDGTFKPDETVTRAQMAAIICRTLGYEDQAQSSMGTTVFNDVAADHWASGYINVAQAQQIINGYGDGNYGPEDLVTYEQAVKMIVSALGYDLAAQAKGGYPTGYLAIASAEGITKNANGRVGDAAARGTIAVLVYNSLEVRLMDQTSWSTGSDGDKYGKTDDTILSKYLEVQKWEGVVASVPVSDYAQDGYKADTTPVFSLETADVDTGSFYQEYWNGQLTKYEDNAVVDVDCSLVDVNEFAGKKVVAYVGEDEDAETGNRMVYAIAEKQGANKVTTISATQLIDSNYSDYTVDGQISYQNVGSSRVYDLDLADDAIISVNFGTATAAKNGANLYDTADLVGHVANGGTITLISNDNDSKIDVIRVTAYDAEAVIETVETEDGVISFDTYVGSIDDIDTEDEDAIVVVYKDGAVATAADLAANDTVSMVTTFENGGDSFQLYYASSKTVTGMVESYSNDDQVVTIAGEEYEVSSLSSYSGNVASLSDKEGLFFLNVDGQIAHDEADAAKGKYGLVLAVNKSTGINNGYEVQVALADGTVATYELSSKAALNGGSKDDDATAIAIASRMGYTVTAEAFGDAKYAKVSTLNSLLFEVTVKNGEITKLKSLGATSEKTGKEYDAENMSYSSLSFDDSTVVFAIKPTYWVDADPDPVVNTAKVEDDDVTVGTIADFFTDGEGENYSLFGYDNDNDIYGAIIGYDLATTVPADSAAVIVTSVKSVTYDDDNAVQITGLQGGKEVSYIIYDDEADYTSVVAPEYLAKGDVIMVGVANAEGVVADFETLYKKVPVSTNTENDSPAVTYEITAGIKVSDDATDDIYYVAGTLNEADGYEPTNNKFFLTGATGSHYVSVDGIAMRDAANYTLVDYSESSNPEISKKSKGKSIFGTLDKYNSTVFVRYYDDKLVEVVVYRTAQ